MAPALSILVVSHNTRAMTLACLDSIVAATREVSYEIIVVDNASTDGSAEAIAGHFAKPHLIARTDNLGFGGGNNLAFEHARGELLLLLNPDTIVLDGAIDRLVAFARRRPAAMVWGGRTLFGDGRLNPSCAWGRMTVWRLACRALGLTGLAPRCNLLNGEALGGWRRDSEREVDIVSGCFFLVPATLWRRVGGFDPVFFMYGEEADLCLRARALGARPAVTPEATIIHHGGASEATREGKMVKLLAAKATLIDRHFAFGLRHIGLALNAAWPLSRWLALTALAAATGAAETKERAGVWKRIWQRRAEWRGGWRAASTAAPHAPRAAGAAETATTPA